MFGLERDERSRRSGSRIQDAVDRKVVALGRAAGKDDLFCCRAQQRRDAFACILDRGLRAPPKGMTCTRGVAEVFAALGKHRVAPAGLDAMIQSERGGAGPRQAAGGLLGSRLRGNDGGAWIRAGAGMTKGPGFPLAWE